MIKKIEIVLIVDALTQSFLIMCLSVAVIDYSFIGLHEILLLLGWMFG